MASFRTKSPLDDARGAAPDGDLDGDLDGALAPGDLISAYRIDDVIGVGGMGWVYRAVHALEGRAVALKVLRQEQVEQERAVDRMMREATILASVAHPGMPRFFECGLLSDGRPWIAMELIDGTPLHDRLARGIAPADEVLALLGSVAEVLAAAHAWGVVHRDLKPDNIILAPPAAEADGAFPVRVIDWGIAHHATGPRLTSMNEALGTPTYMAPEQARGGPTGGFCDVYGLGVVAYQALTGRAPFIGQSSVEILVQHLNRPVPPLAPRSPDAPIALVELVERMLLKRPEDRPTASEVSEEARALEAARRGAAVPSAIYEGNHTPITAQLRVPRID